MKTVFIGAGHNDTSDPGAVSADGQLKEASLAVELRDLIAAELIARRVPVKTDGAKGTNSPLRDSIAIAKTCDGPKVEIHFNAGPPTAKGIECLALRKHATLAQRLCAAITRQTASPLRGVLGYKDQGAGQHHRLGFCVDAEGVVLEVEFISNPSAMATVLAAKNEIAKGIASVLAEAAGVPPVAGGVQ